MSVLVVGISHRSAPVSLLEQVTAGVADTTGILQQLRTTGPVGEAVVLGTCNRVEVYADTDGFHAGVEAVSDLLSRLSGIALEDLTKHLYVHWEGQAVRPQFTVAAGPDPRIGDRSVNASQLVTAGSKGPGCSDRCSPSAWKPPQGKCVSQRRGTLNICVMRGV